jgi:polysaccharide export outer membrane protein
VVLVLALLLASACRTPGSASEAPPPPVQPSTPVHASELGTSDVIEVKVTQEADLSGAYRVGGDGTIDFPFCRRLKVGGLVPADAADKIVDCLKPRYLKNPQVSVFLREYNSKKVFVLGEVQKPGTFPFEQGMTLVQALTLAGSFTKVAARNSCNVTRTVDGEEKHYKISVDDILVGKAPNMAVLPGDIIYVPESFF